jgi:RNA polymerase II C-terminal domain phosphatase-like 3/4
MKQDKVLCISSVLDMSTSLSNNIETFVYIMQVIDRIHKRFFSNKRLREVDVRAILAAEQHQVLAGCCVLFSRIFPVGEANPHVHPLWRMAEQFGATCCLNINDKVTHVVAISLGTDKVTFVTFSETPLSVAFGFSSMAFRLVLE